MALATALVLEKQIETPGGGLKRPSQHSTQAPSLVGLTKLSICVRISSIKSKKYATLSVLSQSGCFFLWICFHTSDFSNQIVRALKKEVIVDFSLWQGYLRYTLSQFKLDIFKRQNNNNKNTSSSTER